jgi:hypothetical protein
LELTNTLGTLWQPLLGGQALGLYLGEEAEAEEAEVEEGEGAVVEDNWPLSLLNNLSLFPQQPTYATWELSPKSSKEKGIKQMPL